MQEIGTGPGTKSGFLQRLMVLLGAILCLYQPVSAVAQPLLTQQEQAFVASAPPVTVCVDPDWEPFETLNAKGEHVGIAADLLRLVAQRVGLRLEILPVKDWDDAVAASKEGRCQIMSFLNQTPKREQWLIFTEPLFRDSNVFITREEHPPIADPVQLQGESIVFPKGTAMEELVRHDYPNLRILNTVSEAEAIAMVNNRQADMTMRSLIVAAYVIKKEGWFNLKISGKLPNYENKLRIGVLKKHDDLRNILNKGVLSITQKDTDEIVNRFVTINISVKYDYKLIFYILLVFILIVVFGGLWAIRLRRANQALARSSHTDALTGLPNRAKLNQRLPVEIERARRFGHAFSVIILDLDHFKQVNDCFGHLIGDQVLIALAQVLLNVCRSYDVVGRWGGEEFLILCPESNGDQAVNVAERICHAVRTYPFATGKTHTISAGVTQFLSGESEDAMLHRADQALYHSKKNGRDQVTLY